MTHRLFCHQIAGIRRGDVHPSLVGDPGDVYAESSRRQRRTAELKYSVVELICDPKVAPGIECKPQRVPEGSLGKSSGVARKFVGTCRLPDDSRGIHAISEGRSELEDAVV